MVKMTILIADDEKNIREGLAKNFSNDYRVLLAADGAAAWKIFCEEQVDLLLSDLRMPEMGGIDLLRRIVEKDPHLPIIMLTAYATVENAVEAMRIGAYDFLTKPLNIERLELLIKRALETRSLREKHQKLLIENQRLQQQQHTYQLIGKSAKMKQVFEQIEQVADSRASVLISGESGTGKELVATALHNSSSRAQKPFVRVHCAALAASLLESELFGHEKGAFTGALNTRRGRFELADKGSLFLDEIGEIDSSLQIKLLRVLEERCFERVGGEKTLHVDVRVISATNRNLWKEVEAGHFREDLFYRLNVVNIEIPPLRERLDDLPLLMANFIAKIAKENKRSINGIEAKAEAALYAYQWPGNIRELRNCIESALLMSRQETIRLSDLPPSLRRTAPKRELNLILGKTLAEMELTFLQETLAYTQGNKSKAARLLGISRKTLQRKLQEQSV